jgi:hypothetical protein
MSAKLRCPRPLPGGKGCSGREALFGLARGPGPLGRVGLAGPPHLLAERLIAVLAQFQDPLEKRLEGVAAVRCPMRLERAPEGYDTVEMTDSNAQDWFPEITGADAMALRRAGH